MANFTINRSRDKAETYVKALTKAGHVNVKKFEETDFVIVDHNYGDGVGTIRRAILTGRPVFKIPHGARADLFWDMLYDTKPEEDVTFVFSRGQRDVLKKGGYPTRIEIMGFPWAKVRPFKIRKLKRILFAPIHPIIKIGNIIRMELFKRWNSSIFDDLVQIKDQYDITVYHCGPIKNNQIRKVDGINYVESDLKLGTALSMIQNTDLVIAHETFSYLAIASGVATIMFDDSHVGWERQGSSKFWPHYRFRYPFNWIKSIDKISLMDEAINLNADVEMWKAQFIGNNFNPNTFVETIEEFLRE